MTWLYEDPWTIGFIGLAGTAILLVAAAQISRGWMIAAGALCVLATGGMLAFERLVVTEREEVEQTLHDAADAIQRGDVNGLLAHVSPQHPNLQSTAKSYMSFLKLDEIKIAGLKVTLNRLTSPPSAKARFRVILKHASGSRSPYPTTPHQVEVSFDHVDGRWLATKYNLERDGL